MYNFTIIRDGLNPQLPLPGFFPTGIDYDSRQVVLPSCTPFIGHEWYCHTSFKDEDYDMENVTLCSAIGLEHHETKSDENPFKRARSSDSIEFVIDMGIRDDAISNTGVSTNEVLSSSLCGLGAAHESHHLSAILSTLSLAQPLDNPSSRQESLPRERCKKATLCTSSFVRAVENGLGWHGASLSGLSHHEEEDDGLDTDTDDNDVSVILDNAFYPPHVKATVKDDEGKGSGVVQSTSSFPPVPAHKDTCGAVIVAEQFLPTLPPDGSLNDTDNEDEPRKPLEREATEPLEDGQDQPLAVFHRFSQGVSAGSLEESFRSPAPIPKQVLPSVCDDKVVLQFFDHGPTKPLEEEEDGLSSAFLHAEAGNFLRRLEDDLRTLPQVSQQVLPSAVASPSAAFLRAGARDFLRSTKVTFPSKPQVPQQVIPSAAESRRASDRETTEPLEEGKARTPTPFLSYEPRVPSNSIDTEVRTPSRVPQQVQPSVNSGERTEPFEREATEPLEEEQDRVPPVFHNYDQCIPADLLSSYADDCPRIQDPQQVLPSSSSGDDPRKPFVRELPPLLDEAHDKPPAAFMNAQSIVNFDERFMAQPTPAPVIEQGYASCTMANTAFPPSLPPFHNQSQPATVFRSTNTGRRMVLNKLGRPVRHLTREQLKRALGGAPCDPSPVTTPTSTENQGNGDEDEREERTDPAKKSRCEVHKEPLHTSLAPPEKRVRFGGERRTHFENAIARFSTRSQCSTIRPILRRTAKEPTQTTLNPSSSGIAFDASASTSGSNNVIDPVPRLRSPLPVPRRQPRRGANVSYPGISVQSGSEADRAPPSSFLLVDELERKNACRRRNTQCRRQRAAEAAGGVVRNARQNCREDWIRIRRRRGSKDNSVSSFLVGVRTLSGLSYI